MLGTLAILGVPPFGVFASEFLILTTAMHQQPWATPILLFALAVAFAAVFGRVQPMVFGESNVRRLPHQPALLPVFLHLALVLMLGLYIPAVPRRLVPTSGSLDRMSADDASIFDLVQPLPGPVQAVGRRTVAAEHLHERGVSCCTAEGGASDRAVGRRRYRPCARRFCAACRLSLTRSGLFCLRAPAALRIDGALREHRGGLYPAALRMQRATYDLLGIHAQEAGDSRKWLRHGAWPGGTFPLRRCGRDQPGCARARCSRGSTYPSCGRRAMACTRSRSGPVHAGIIEPGHFRFSVVGEKVLRLEERLGYVHKGIEKRSAEHDGPRDAARLAASRLAVIQRWRMRGRTRKAVESIARVTIRRARALWLRALALELERIANHLGDLGYLGNDAGFAFGLFQFCG
jgi:hypothetical protein